MSWIDVKRCFTNPKRSWIWIYSKIVKGSGTPGYIARGWAIGVFVGTVVPIFCQLVISIPLAFLLKGSKLGATIGTMHTNPLTVVFIYPVQCYLGNRLIGGSLSLTVIKQSTAALVKNGDFNSFAGMGAELIKSFFAGGLFAAAILTPAVFFFVLFSVKQYRKIREKRLAAAGNK